MKYKEYIAKNKFNQKAYDSSDAISKQAVIKLLERMGFVVIDNTEYDKYAVDLTAYFKNKRYDIDVEMRYDIWSGYKFPFSSVHIPYRKKKFIASGNEFRYIVVNRELSHCLISKKDAIDISKFVSVDTPRMKEEPFFDVPLSKFTLVKL